MTAQVILALKDGSRRRAEALIRKLEEDEDGGWSYRLRMLAPDRCVIDVFDEHGVLVGEFR